MNFILPDNPLLTNIFAATNMCSATDLHNFVYRMPFEKSYLFKCKNIHKR